MEIKEGSVFGLGEEFYEFKKVEGNLIILRNLRTDTFVTYGLQAFERIIEKAGYRLAK